MGHAKASTLIFIRGVKCACLGKRSAALNRRGIVNNIVLAKNVIGRLASYNKEVRVFISSLPHCVVDLPHIHVKIVFSDYQFHGCGRAPDFLRCPQLLIAGVFGTSCKSGRSIGLYDDVACGTAVEKFVVRQLERTQDCHEYNQFAQSHGNSHVNHAARLTRQYRPFQRLPICAARP